MSVTLTQSTDAAFPDRGATGLLASLATGNDGAYLVHDLGSERSVLYVRLLLNPATAAGGHVRIAGAQDGSDAPAWWLDYDTDARQVTFELASGEQVSTTLNSLPWHCLELKLDSVAGEAALWVNGRSVGELTGSFAGLAMQRLWIGALAKDTAVAGELYLDEWAIGEEFLGPARVEPSSVYADDPARWLVLYNAGEADAVTWAEQYRQARGVPFANLLGLAVSSDEVIDAAQYSELVDQINAYLQSTALNGQVMGLLVGYRVPGYVDYFDNGRLDAVPALLQHDGALLGPTDNFNAEDALPTRPDFGMLGDDRLTARIDGPDLATAQALLDRATTLMEAGLGTGDQATLWLDPFAGSGSIYDPHIQRMIDWAQSTDRMRTRLPFQLSGDPDEPDEPAGFDQLSDDGFFWGWPDAAPPADFFAEPGGQRVLCVQLHLLSATATTVRAVSAGNWVDVPREAGYAAAVAASRDYSSSAVPYARPFFEALRQGWTLAEAWYLALPVLQEGLYLVGDPLLRVRFPEAGWDLFGPLPRLEALDPAGPSHAVREPVRELALPEALQPTVNEQGVYVLRHVDDQGRSEASLSLVRLERLAEGAALPSLAPLWPDQLDWPVTVEDGQVRLRIDWGRALETCRMASVALRGEVDGGAEATLAQWSIDEPAVDPRAWSLAVDQPLPGEQARYRWRITSPTGVVRYTPWSNWLRPREAPSRALSLVEVQR